MYVDDAFTFGIKYAGLDTQYSQVSQEACTRARESSEKGDRNGKERVKFPI